MKTTFLETFGEKPQEIHFFWAPGRVNLIGEHLDYNGGMVFPCPLSIGIHLLARRREDDKLLFHSKNFPESPVFNLNSFPESENSWCRYPLGVINELMKLGHKFSGLELFYRGDIPQGAGLSSSAAMEVVTTKALNKIFKLNLSSMDIIKISQKAENNYVGVACGIMDQFAIGMGELGKGVAINCENLDYQLIPLNISDHQFIVANTNFPRSLGDGPFNQRRQECEKALRGKTVWQEIDLNSLSGTLLKRARHVISENQRVLSFLKAIQKSDLKEAGRLMNKSHQSLKEDFEVTNENLDILVEISQGLDYVRGSRMTGAGFGGCTINLVETHKVKEYCHQVGMAYENHFGLAPEFYQVSKDEK